MTDSIVAKKRTLGKQLLDVRSKEQHRQEVRETTNEMSKEYLQSLEKVIDQHEHIPGIYYIMEIMHHDHFLEGVLKLKHIARRSPPRPEWGIGCFKVDNTHGEIYYEWGLPLEQDAFLVLQNKEHFDLKLVEDIEKHLRGELEPGVKGRFNFEIQKIS